jgi:hypothetical protein
VLAWWGHSLTSLQQLCGWVLVVALAMTHPADCDNPGLVLVRATGADALEGSRVVSMATVPVGCPWPRSAACLL